jgi:hypothetical protein
MALCPPSDWDSLMYHLQVPKEWLLNGRIYVPDGNDHVAFIGVTQMLYLPFLAVGSFATPAVLSALLSIAVALAAFAICCRCWSQPVGNYILVAVWGSPAIILVGITARVDVTVTLFTLLAHYALLLAWMERSRSWLDVAAILAGLAFGVKYQGGLYVAALVPLAFLICWRDTRPEGSVWRPLARFGSIALLTASPWLLKNMLLLHAPFYPFVTHQLPPAAWLSSFPTSASIIDPRAYDIGRLAREPFNLIDAFFSPVKVTIEGEGRFYYLSPVLLLLPLLLLKGRDRLLVGLAIPPLLYLVALVGISRETNLRYLLPAAVPLTIVATTLAIQFSTTAPRALRVATRAFVLIGSAFSALVPMCVMMLVAHPLGHLAGITSANEYLRQHGSFGVRQHQRLTQFANSVLPPNSRTLMLFESRGFYFNTPVIQDVRLRNWALLVSRLPHNGCPEGTSITHIVAGEGYAERYVQRGVPADVVNWQLFTRFAAQCLTLMYADSALSLYKMDAHTRPGSPH